MLEQLYRLHPARGVFSINNVALVEGGPQTLGLRDLLQVYIDHRIEVVTRRTRYRLARRQERLHLVEGLLIAILDIDEVIQVIRASDDTEAARVRLIDVFDLSVLQADYILELRLRRLTRFSRIELEAERDSLRRRSRSSRSSSARPRGFAGPCRTNSTPLPTHSAPPAARCSPRRDRARPPPPAGRSPWCSSSPTRLRDRAQHDGQGHPRRPSRWRGRLHRCRAPQPVALVTTPCCRS